MDHQPINCPAWAHPVTVTPTQGPCGINPSSRISLKNKPAGPGKQELTTPKSELVSNPQKIRQKQQTWGQ